MSKDVSRLVDGWPYDPGEVRARWIAADDGTRKLQLRLDLGVFQMEPEGRPDGTRPRGAASLCDFYVEAERRAPGNVLPDKLEFDACDCDHNLDLIDVVSEYALDDEVAWQFMQLYPYMRMMHARAGAETAMADGRFDEAEKLVREGIQDLEGFYEENYEPTNEDGSPVPPPLPLPGSRSSCSVRAFSTGDSSGSAVRSR